MKCPHCAESSIVCAGCRLNSLRDLFVARIGPPSAFDLRMLAWCSHWEPSTTEWIASLIEYAHPKRMQPPPDWLDDDECDACRAQSHAARMGDIAMQTKHTCPSPCPICGRTDTHQHGGES